MKPISNPEKLAFCTVRIETRLTTGATGTGTGFLFGFCKKGDLAIPAIVTNRHVLTDARYAEFVLHLAKPNGDPHRGLTIPARIECSPETVVNHPDPAVDLCVVPINSLIQQAAAASKPLFMQILDASIVWPKSRDVELSGVDDILMVGYPNGIWDTHNNMPIMRKGITATHPALDYLGKAQFLIDAACFPGSSGSPIFLYDNGMFISRDGSPTVGNRIALLGIQYAVYHHTSTGELRVIDTPTAQTVAPRVGIPNNLGLAIKAEKLLEFEATLDHRAQSMPVARQASAEMPFQMEGSRAEPGNICPCGSGLPFAECHGASSV